MSTYQGNYMDELLKLPESLERDPPLHAGGGDYWTISSGARPLVPTRAVKPARTEASAVCTERISFVVEYEPRHWLDEVVAPRVLAVEHPLHVEVLEAPLVTVPV